MAFVEGANPEKNIHQLLHTLDAVTPRLKERQDDLAFVRNVISSNDFKILMRLYQEVTSGRTKDTRPVSLNALEVSHSLIYDLDSVPDPLTSELMDLLSDPHINALITAHDYVANKEYPSEYMEDSKGDRIKTIWMQKGNNPLGATIKQLNDNNVCISRVLHGSVADKSGLLHPGDILHSINGESVDGKSIDEIADIMQNLQGIVAFKITPASDYNGKSSRNRQPVMKVRTHFSYDPTMDDHLPCQEAGLSFNRGDILTIVDQEDPDWWQAIKEGNAGTGLVPSLLQQQRRDYSNHAKGQLNKKLGTLGTLRRKIKARKVVYDSSHRHDYCSGDALPYDEVVKIAPQNNRPRPLILTSSTHPYIKLQDVVSHLMTTHKGHFMTVHHSSQASAATPVAPAIRDILQVMESGQTCLIALPSNLISKYYVPALKPFVIFFRAPREEHVPQLTSAEYNRLSKDNARQESLYFHMYDVVKEYSDVQSTSRNVFMIANRLRKDFQWIPASWTQKV